MSKRKNAVFWILFLLLSLCSCSGRPVEAPDISAPADTSAPGEVPVPKPADPMDGIYPVTDQEDAAEILKQAYEGMIPQLTFAFSDAELSLQDRSIFLQNASNQILSQHPELKYAYQLECEDGSDGTVCKILYMPYKLGYPGGLPEGGVEIRSLADLAEVADAHLGEEEIPITILNPDLLVDDMQRALQQAGYGYVLYMLNSDATAICGGFSWAFNMLCREAGIPCWNVTGVDAGEEHMWNCARMNGEYRYFDTTWDAGVTYEEQWRYFACTEEEITQNHQWGPGQKELIHALTDVE